MRLLTDRQLHARAASIYVIIREQPTMSQDRIAARLGLSPVTVGKAVLSLEEHGWVVRRQNRSGYVYTFPLPDTIDQEEAA